MRTDLLDSFSVACQWEDSGGVNPDTPGLRKAFIVSGYRIMVWRARARGGGVWAEEISSRDCEDQAGSSAQPRLQRAAQSPCKEVTVAWISDWTSCTLVGEELASSATFLRRCWNPILDQWLVWCSG